MWKNTFALMVIGSLVSTTGFATPFFVKKMFMKDHHATAAVYNKQTQDQFKFSGTWVGTCNFEGQSNEAKLRMVEDEDRLAVTDLVHDSYVDTFSFNRIQTENTSDKDWYDSFTMKLTRLNDHTLKIEGSGVFAEQPAYTDNKQIPFISGVYTTLLSVKNGQLTIESTGKSTESGKESNSAVKCTLNKVG